MKKKAAYLLLVSLSLICLLPAFNEAPKKVVCFGDSITFGALVNGHSWVYFLSQQQADINFVNAGRSGRKTSDKTELLPVLKEHPDADCYLLFLGVNDLKDGTDSLVNTCVANMQWMISEIKQVDSDAKIVILAPTDINLQTMNEINVNKKYNQNTKHALYSLEKKYQELATKDQIGFISLLHAVSPQNYVDGLHPNAGGQQEISKVIGKQLRKFLK